MPVQRSPKPNSNKLFLAQFQKRRNEHWNLNNSDRFHFLQVSRPETGRVGASSSTSRFFISRFSNRQIWLCCPHQGKSPDSASLTLWLYCRRVVYTKLPINEWIYHTLNIHPQIYTYHPFTAFWELISTPLSSKERRASSSPIQATSLSFSSCSFIVSII